MPIISLWCRRLDGGDWRNFADVSTWQQHGEVMQFAQDDRFEFRTTMNHKRPDFADEEQVAINAR